MSKSPTEPGRPGVSAPPETRDRHVTVSGQPIPLLATPADISGLDYDRDLGNPGEYPYTRGVHADMYRGKPWTMRQFAGFGTAEGLEPALQVPARAAGRPASRSPSTCPP